MRGSPMQIGVVFPQTELGDDVGAVRAYARGVEEEGLGKDFASRGASLEEQIHLLRRLWTEPSVSHSGRTDTVTGAGIAPRPVQRPIPVWIGGRSAPAYRRMGRSADGWFPQMRAPDHEVEAPARIVVQAAAPPRRDSAAIGPGPRPGWDGGRETF